VNYERENSIADKLTDQNRI